MIPTTAASEPRSLATLVDTIVPYGSIARPDHWFKNVFMIGGVVLAAFYSPTIIEAFPWIKLVLGLVAVCLVASSNYVINEILDAPKDIGHPVKRMRPIPSGRVKFPIAYAEWIVLGIVGTFIGWLVNMPFFLSAVALWVMGFFYNVPPFRTKEVPYLDVVSESVNNPLRLLMGWFVVTPEIVPPVSVLAAYWMVGAFFMASKRFAEYRLINDKAAATAYRSSFRHYNEERLLVSMFFYTAACALMLGVFIVRYKLELLLSVPLLAGFFSYYLHVTFKENSPVQNPEHLYKQYGLMIYLAVTVVIFFGLLFVEVPALYELFNVTPSQLKSLWTIGS
ncbi:MAG TPA: prenyltransferase [Planctomycetaceae bacterium]|nr:prenyltransferase [Planctomycetaceae bacterium]